MLHTLTEDMESDEGMGFDIDREEFSILSGPREIGHDQSLSAALIALDECHSSWGDVDIEGFFVWVLEIRSVVAEELSGGETEASCTSDFERSETVDVRLWHRLFARVNLIRYFQTRRPVDILMKALVEDHDFVRGLGRDATIVELDKEELFVLFWIVAEAIVKGRGCEEICAVMFIICAIY